MTKDHFKEYVGTVAKTMGVSIKELSRRLGYEESTIHQFIRYSHPKTKVKICHLLRDMLREEIQ
jgi:lambda repressor-like predicted transcriptional regulator